MSLIEKQSFDYELIQPNRVTSARYDFTPVQENFLTIAIDKLQKHMNRLELINKDIFGGYELIIDSEDISLTNNKGQIIKQLENLRLKAVEYEWTNLKGKKERVNTGIVGAVRTVENSKFIAVELSNWAIPWLTYWGKIEGSQHNGHTRYFKSTALTLPGEHTKRLYKLCSRWKDRGGFTIPLDEFKRDFGLENSYKRVTDFKKHVLDSSRDKLKEADADLYFEYSLDKVRSRSFNMINFKIFSKQSSKDKENHKVWYSQAYAYLCRVFPREDSDKAIVVTDKLKTEGKLRPILKRFENLDDSLTSGKMSFDKHVNIMKKLLREDYGIE